MKQEYWRPTAQPKHMYMAMQECNQRGDITNIKTQIHEQSEGLEQRRTK